MLVKGLDPPTDHLNVFLSSPREDARFCMGYSFSPTIGATHPRHDLIVYQFEPEDLSFRWIDSNESRSGLFTALSAPHDKPAASPLSGRPRRTRHRIHRVCERCVVWSERNLWFNNQIGISKPSGLTPVWAMRSGTISVGPKP